MGSQRLTLATSTLSTSTDALSGKVQRAAAFYDLDGTLCSTNVVHASLFVAQQQPTLLKRLKRTASLYSSLPLFFATDLYSRKLFNEMFYHRYKGESIDRLKMMAHQLFNDVIKPTIFDQAYHMIAQSKRAGLKQVLVTGSLDILAHEVAAHLGMDHYVANELECVDGYCTGTIKYPLIAGASKASWMRRYAQHEGFDLDNCFAYSDSFSDYPMLAVVGKPAVVNPDRRLKQLARSFDWPVLQFK